MLAKPLVHVELGVARGLLWVIGLGLLWAASGCGRPVPTNRHDVLAGTVHSLRPDMGQLTVHTTAPRPELGSNPNLQCLLSSDAEVYINDKFSTSDAIVVGDNVELIGYMDPDPRAERFVVCLVYIARSEPLPPSPDLTAPSTAPTVPDVVQDR
jgi:hypothetical protein